MSVTKSQCNGDVDLYLHSDCHPLSLGHLLIERCNHDQGCDERDTAFCELDRAWVRHLVAQKELSDDD